MGSGCSASQLAENMVEEGGTEKGGTKGAEHGKGAQLVVQSQGAF